MNPLRLVIVSPRFWPHMGDAELFAGHLADELFELGVRPLILSAKWSPQWPSSIFVRECEVVRLPHAPRGGWSTIRYMLDLSRWMRSHRSDLDAVYVMGLRQEAYATLSGLAGSRVPVVLRCHHSGPAGDCAWQEVARFGDRIRRQCRLADAVVVSDSAAAQELARCGYRPDRLHVVPCGAVIGGSRSADQRFRARTALSDINHDLAAAEYAPVAVSAGRLTEPLAYVELLDAWREIASRWPSSRLWITGDGPAREKLHAMILDRELQYQVLMPGTFEDLTDLFLAADLFVDPQPQAGLQTALEAMAAGLPVLAAGSPEFQTIIENGRTGMLIPNRIHAAWSKALSYLFENPAAAVDMGGHARRFVEQHYSRRQMAERHLELFRALVERNMSGELGGEW